MKKVKIILIIILINLVNIKIAKARLIYTSPEIKGQIVDATTGEPIEKAIVNVLWWEYGATQLGGGASPFKIVTVITEKDGKYKIPKYRCIYIRGIGSIFNTFSHQSIEVYHPLYENTRLGYIWRKDDETGEEKYKGTQQPNGSIHYDIKLVGVEEKYLKPVLNLNLSEEDRKKGVGAEYQIEFLSFLGSLENGWYWEVLKKNNISYNLEDIFNKWDTIADGFDKAFDVPYTKRDINHAKNNIRKNLMEGKK